MLLHNNVFDAALNVVAACDECEVRTSASAILINSITLDSGNFGSPIDNSSAGNGRKIECLHSSGNDMKAISVGTGGAAKKIVLLDSSVVIAVASLSSAVSLGSSDQVNLGAFYVILKDPT